MALDLNGTSSIVTGGGSGLGEATARQLIARVPAGQMFKPLGGTWTKK